MFEARLIQGVTLKKIMEAIKELVQEANFDCTPKGISMQAMDTSHVSLVALFLGAAGFTPYRVDRPLSLGITLASMVKVPPPPLARACFLARRDVSGTRWAGAQVRGQRRRDHPPRRGRRRRGHIPVRVAE